MATVAPLRPATFPVPPVDPRRHHVQTTLNYYKPPAGGGPPPTIYPFKPETHNQASPTEPVEVTIHDIAGEELKYTLDTHGFQIHYHETRVKDFSDAEAIRREYHPETEKMLKDLTGATRVHMFDPIVRKSQTDPNAATQGPVPLVHIDQTPQEAYDRARCELGDEFDELAKGRFQIINVWRPIKTIYRDPFAVADARSIDREDLIFTKVGFPDREGSTFNVKKNHEHRFYYRYGQTPNLVTLFKCYDSGIDGAVRGNPHTAFVNPETVDHPPRESIEIRALLFYPEK